MRRCGRSHFEAAAQRYVMASKSDRRWTVAIRPRTGEVLRKITKIIGLKGDGFSVLTRITKLEAGSYSNT
jgi:hypothetical protein